MFNITNSHERETLGQFNVLPAVLIRKIAGYCPKTSALLNKYFYNSAYKELEFQWQSLKNSEKTPSEIKIKVNLIEEKNTTEGIFAVIGKFFKSLKTCQGTERIPVDFSNLRNEMLRALQDHNLCQLWSYTSNILALEKPPVSAMEIRIWMSNADNQKRLAQISHLNLTNLELTDIPPEITYFRGTTCLSLSNNLLTHLPSYIDSFEALETFNLTNNHLMDLPGSIGELVKLSWLNVNYNRLTCLPLSIGKLVNLKTLWLSNNQLKDIPPDSISKIRGLQQLVLTKNQLTSLPDCIHQLGELQDLDLGNNQLTDLPNLIGKLVLLQILLLDNNRLTGLPDSICDLEKLSMLNLENNLLTHLPASIHNAGRNARSPLELTIGSSLLLLISDCALNKFKVNQSIKDFIKLRDMAIDSPLGKVCKMIRIESDKILNGKFTDTETLGHLVDELDHAEQEQIYNRIWQKAWNKNRRDSFSWGKENRFKDMMLFVSVLGELMYQAKKKYTGCWN